MTPLRPPCQLELALPMPGRSEAPRPEAQEVEAVTATAEPESLALTDHLMEAICAPDNLEAALRAVVRNKGAPGIDGITVKQLPGVLQARWPEIEGQLRQGRYQPQPVRRVTIPKPAGGTRNLGIPTVIDRVIQQAVLQRLQPLWDPTVQRAQLRLPAGPLRPPSGGAGASLRHRRLSVRRGYRPGPVLRPGEPRSFDGRRGGACLGPAGAPAHPELSDGRRARQRALREQPGGSPARRSPLALVVEPRSGRAGS